MIIVIRWYEGKHWSKVFGSYPSVPVPRIGEEVWVGKKIVTRILVTEVRYDIENNEVSVYGDKIYK